MKKKVLLLAPMGSVHRRFNGVNIQALKQLGCEIHLLANFGKGDGPEEQNPQYVEKCKNEEIFIHSLPFQRRSLLSNLSLSQKVASLIDQEDFAIVHAHTETGGLILRLAGRHCGCKYIFTPHGMSFYKGGPLYSQLMYQPIEYWISRGMEANIAINQEEFQVLQKWNVRTAHLVHGIGLDLSRFGNANGEQENLRKSLGIPQDAIVVLSVGELDENKNHRIILYALAALQNPSLHYVVCGVGPQRDYLQAEAQKCGIGNRFHLLGYRRDIPELLKMSDIFVFPSLHEGLPVSLMEAMASHLPVIASNIRGNRDLLQKEQKEFLCAPENYQDFAEKIQLFFKNEILRRESGKINYKTIQTFSKENVEEEFLDLYSRLLVRK